MTCSAATIIRTALTVTLGMMLCAAAPVAAQQSLKQTVTVTATASPVPFESLSRAIVVITRDQIDRLPVASITDLLQYAASVDVRSRGPLGVQTDVAIRGATFGQTLVLVDGVRLNDSQSGHHNGDIPVLLDDVERIEILYGAGSSLYGADAFGGTINVVTRERAGARHVALTGGQFGFADGAAGFGVARGAVAESIGVDLTRSSGFMTDREFRTAMLSSSTTIGERTHVAARYQDKAFGANGFYGASPSKEWTNQTLLTVDHRWPAAGAWSAQTGGWYRTHGDHFLWDVARPGFAENFHRTHALGADVRVRRTVFGRGTATLGGEAGRDWIRSNNLGGHAIGRSALFAELQQRIGRTATVQPALRYDRYTTFGSAWSPSVAASVWLAGPIKLRGSIGRAFRVPTFTELYYRDPNNQGTATLVPERAWAGDAGLDWIVGAGWMATGTLFQRHERDVIDWIRATPLVPWRADNLREVATRGVEVGTRRTFGSGDFFDVQYTHASADAGVVTFLSKYVLEYARHSLAASAGLRLPGAVTLGSRLGYKRRVDGTEYWTADARVARPIGFGTAFVEGTNLTGARYQEIRGVDMPGRWLRAGVTVRR